MSFEDPSFDQSLILPNPEQFRQYGHLFFIQIQVDTSDQGDIKEQIRQAMQIEQTLAAFCRGEISLAEFFELSEIFLGGDRIDEYVDEVCDSLESELQPLVLPYGF